MQQFAVTGSYDKFISANAFLLQMVCNEKQQANSKLKEVFLQ